MKKNYQAGLLFLCLSLFQISSAFCQEDSTHTNANNNGDNEDVQQVTKTNHRHSNQTNSRVAFGIEGGVNLAVLDIDNTNSDINVGGTLGVLVDIRMFGKFYIEPGLFYVMNGGDNLILNNGSTVDWTINAIEVPVNIEFKTGKPGDTHFIIGIGPYFANNISGSSSDGTSLKIGSGSNDQLKASDIGIGLNIGLELRSGLFFRIREQRGISNLQPSLYGAGTVYSASDAVTIGFLFGKHHKHNTRHPQQKTEKNVWDE